MIDIFLSLCAKKSLMSSALLTGTKKGYFRLLILCERCVTLGSWQDDWRCYHWLPQLVVIFWWIARLENGAKFKSSALLQFENINRLLTTRKLQQALAPFCGSSITRRYQVSFTNSKLNTRLESECLLKQFCPLIESNFLNSSLSTYVLSQQYTILFSELGRQ